MSSYLFAILAVMQFTSQDVSVRQVDVPVVPVIAPAEIAANPSNRLNFELSSGGTVVILLRPDAAPMNVHRVQTLASQGFYNGTVFHRVQPGFMAQGGDPDGNGHGGSTLPDLKAEFTTLPHLRGVMAMARTPASVDSANSQFYIMLAPDLTLDRDYTVIGRVISGMQYVDAIAPGEPPPEPSRVVRAWLDGPLPPAPMAPAVPEAAPAQ